MADDMKKEQENGCYCGRGQGENDGCCGGHGHGEKGDCCGDDGHGEQEEFDYEKHDVKLPDPTLTTIVSTLAQQAMLSMGILPNPSNGKSVFMMNQAKYLIDSIDVLYNKTEGNRTEDETRIISNVMSELRMLYVKAVEEKARRAAAK